MKNSPLMEPSVDEATKFRDFLRQGLAEMDRLAASATKTLAEIHVLSEQTDVILATLKVK